MWHTEIRTQVPYQDTSYVYIQIQLDGMSVQAISYKCPYTPLRTIVVGSIIGMPLRDLYVSKPCMALIRISHTQDVLTRMYLYVQLRTMIVCSVNWMPHRNMYASALIRILHTCTSHYNPPVWATERLRLSTPTRHSILWSCASSFGCISEICTQEIRVWP